MMQWPLRLAGAGGVAVILASVALGTVIHVPLEYPTIQAGIDAAVDGDTVLVADGTYSGDGNRDIDFGGKAILVTSENGPGLTIIDCEGDSLDPHRGFCFHTGEDSTSILHGFTITNGWNEEGGGIHCQLSSPTIAGNAITGNEAGTSGGGIYCYESSPPIEGNNVTVNTAGLYGGGICCESNSNPVIQGNTIASNAAGHGGGGIRCADYCYPVVKDNTIAGNTARANGGGFDCDSHCTPTIIHNTITGNKASGHPMITKGGGIRSGFSYPTIEHNTITGNSADHVGGGIYSDNDLSCHITGNTIAENIAYLEGGGFGCRGCSPIVEGNMIAGNTAYHTAGAIFCNNAAPTIARNTITGNTAVEDAGAIFCQSSTTVTGNTITGNIARYGYGGAIVCDGSPTIEDNTIIGNTAYFDGGAIYSYNYSVVEVRGNTITDNAACRGGGIACCDHSSLTVVDCILWGNSAAAVGQEIYADAVSSITVTYSDIEGGWPGEGNIDADPLFVAGPQGNYYLSQIAAGQIEDSPCVDAGDPGSPVPDGTTRTDEVFDEWPADMGYHYYPCALLLVNVTPDTSLVFGGQDLWFTVDIENLTDTTLIFDAWADGYLPDSSPYVGNPVLGPVAVTLIGNQGLYGVRQHLRIPPGAPHGYPYMLCVRTGLHPNSMWAQDCFQFAIVPAVE